jgi:serine/threonine-protein kinase ATR
MYEMCQTLMHPQQLLEIAKAQMKYPYTLVSQYLSQVATFVVPQKCTNPMLIFETCQFISVHPTDFISVTLPKTLPYLFANSDAKVIEEISEDLGETILSLFMEHSHQILANVYQQHGPAQTTESLTFIMNIISRGAEPKPADFTVQGMVQSCVVALLTDLVVVLGHENEERAALV